ncbi:PhzF family phenazine biosynthesis protein [Helicobacter sp. MIT 11-5569]|uniref:PhzF family phenazine biosynthesis protein n=1 Tax=Helicobacter sp. MIT 11-5569 TaxID=1548151 RepID=UPI00051F90B8|nr:PhzF family phenazine biosynthesis protein [Helicobacter sp. MIT 11-5569]TLD84569.1 PhzF family phenazine biosynthesis protein [Helicobacter sp. MIT 11-5569]
MQCYVIDAFSDKIFSRNPAAVCLLQHQWLEDSLMQKIANEHNLSETAFCLCQDKQYKLRWFTPAGEIELCGHATLASAFVVMNFVDSALKEVAFETKSGILRVRKNGDKYGLDLPSFALTPLELTKERVQKIEEAIGYKPIEIYLGRDLICVLENEEQVRSCKPNMSKVLELEGVLCHITTKGIEDFDCVSRSFAPKHGVDEDPVCGSGHCHLVPLWSKKLGKAQILAYQASKRGGVLLCCDKDERVSLAGDAVLYSTNTIALKE